ncbi:hypothetical protein V5799_006190 [Amblyomma americanum]|uniref:Uncharacterized protein n=1 Tax=Amblyomma americanum TaxID=6943 RepID=A0AAQ4DX39_AMBAM
MSKHLTPGTRYTHNLPAYEIAIGRSAVIDFLVFEGILNVDIMCDPKRLMTMATDVNDGRSFCMFNSISIGVYKPKSGNFRVRNEDLRELESALLIPSEVYSAQRVRVSGSEALCMTLQRLAYLNRLCDLEHMINRHSSGISSIVSKTLVHIEYYFAHLLIDLATHKWLNLQALELFSQVPGILKETQLYQNLEKITMGHKYVIYGDPAAAVAVQALWRRRPAATSRCLQQGHEWLET